MAFITAPSARSASSELSSASSRAMASSSGKKRGAFILLEGVDRCGKTTQCSFLLKHLLSLSIATVALRFPDRTTPVGQLIDSYLRSGADVDDRAVHLLFSANRWEVAPTLAQTLADGNTIVCDRYAYSGVAFSSAKQKEGGEDILSMDWCKGPDFGLPAPDAVLFLDLDQDEAEKRGGYGGERYEKRDLQLRVRERFSTLQSADEKDARVPWHIIDASKSIEDVQANIWSVVSDTLNKVDDGKPLMKMWEEGHYELPPPTNTKEEEEKKI
uniref:Thymidylate kinase n=1 Tax=Ditylum brightwellii TaxID=49249 RepID=A0A6U3TMZ0_9STRA|mmetsp:Transcript_38596/g.57897  ORF Transcript_38596/g.57897 Transcript_38596/m.57897 type:complete len:271 (+) Transcript_38596:70-882(+)